MHGRHHCSSHEPMPAGKYGIAYEGYHIIFSLTIATLTLAMLGYTFLAILTMHVFFFAMHFFKDPHRIVPTEENIAVSPADGKIIRIQEREDPIDGQTKTCVSIFMNVFSVHVNRTPVEGTIKKIKYIPGLFLNADLDKASTDNERCAYQMEDKANNVWTFVQVSGLVARRIVCRVEEGTELKRGQRFGLIRFGSRVDVFLPANYTPSVFIGEKVHAGESILAKLQD